MTFALSLYPRFGIPPPEKCAPFGNFLMIDI